MQANIKTKNRKKLKVKALVDFGCIHTGIDKQLVKDKKIQIRPINFSFEVFNADGTKNGEVTKVVPLEIEINRHKEKLEAAVINLDGIDMFVKMIENELSFLFIFFLIFIFLLIYFLSFLFLEL